MKKRIITLLLAVFTIGSAFGQIDQGYNFYLQAFGNSTGLGVGFDTRFTPVSRFGYSVGLAYTDIEWDNDYTGVEPDRHDVWSKGLVVPLEVNGIFGNRASKFEIGIGAAAYFIHREDSRRYEKTVFNDYGRPYGMIYSVSESSGFRVNVCGTLSLGYRLQRKSGFFMKLGLTFLIGDFSCSPIDGMIPLPNLCLGYTIPHF